MDNARRQVSGRIDRIARRTAQRKADHPNRERDRQGTDRAQSNGQRGDIVRQRDLSDCNVKDDEQQRERPDQLGEKIPAGAPNFRSRTENGQLGPRVRRRFEMRPVGQPNQNRPERGPDHLGRHVREHPLPRKLSRQRKSERNGRVQVSAAVGSRHDDPDEHGQRPCRRNDHPASGMSLGFVEYHVGDYAVAHQDHKHRPE